VSLRERVARVERLQQHGGDDRPWEMWRWAAHGSDLWQHEQTGEVCALADLQTRPVRRVLIELPAPID